MARGSHPGNPPQGRRLLSGRVACPGSDGRIKQFTKTKRTKKEAERFLASALVGAANGVVPANPKMTVAEFLASWLTVYDPPKQSTKLLREQIVRLHLVPGLGTIKLSALDTFAIDQFFAAAKSGTNRPRSAVGARPSGSRSGRRCAGR
jgi:hypothetical protein